MATEALRIGPTLGLIPPSFTFPASLTFVADGWIVRDDVLLFRSLRIDNLQLFLAPELASRAIRLPGCERIERQTGV
jgi:hypothetical protein